MGGKNSAPSADPRMGEAALKSAETGAAYLSFMRDQAGITNQWASDDRARDIDTFRPLQDKYIADAESWASPERKAAAANEAGADVALAARIGRGQQQRQAMAMGVNPASGAYAAQAGKQAAATQLATAGAGNMARRRIEGEADVRQANAINMGSGLAVNPGTSMGLSNSAMSSGFNGAMQGYNQQASIYGQQHQQQMQSWQANQDSQSGLFGAMGNIMGMLPMMSDENAKTDKQPVKRSMLKAVEGMRVEDWSYKPGMGDGGNHIGTYAQDFKRATGKGDGRTIPVVDAIGATMGAIKELSAKVDAMGAKPAAQAKPKARKVAA